MEASVTRRFATACISTFALAATALAQPGGGPGGGGPPQPLVAPPAPAGNPVTVSRVNLGKALFWDEQLSSTRLTACGTCHIPEHGGVDPRAIAGSLRSLHPGPDGLMGTPDDINGSPGVPLSNATGAYEWDAFFGIAEQVTGRKAPTMINAAYSPLLFWDGRATTIFEDPTTGLPILGPGAALESQASGPPVSTAEMGHLGQDWTDVASRIEASVPLAIASEIPADLALWINDRSYASLFEEAFGTPDVTPARIAMAIAGYERTLFSNQAPIDDFFGGNPQALTPAEARGQAIFNASDCVDCHSGNLFTDNQFHYIGVRPVNEDLGRFDVTGNPVDMGAFKTPNLRNVELHGSFFHNGQFETLEEVVDFYNRGGDFNAPNKSPLIRPLGLNAGQRADLVAFLRRPLTDPRVPAGDPPFDRPTLFTESACIPMTIGNGVAGSGGFIPANVTLESPNRGNDNMTIGVFGGLGGATAILVVDTNALPPGGIPLGTVATLGTTLGGNGDGDGFGSVNFSIPDLPTWVGQTLIGRWYIEDPNATGGIACSPAFTFTIFEDCGEPGCPGDIDDNRGVDFADLNAILNNWQRTVSPGTDGDTDLNGIVNFADLNVVLSNWGSSCL